MTSSKDIYEIATELFKAQSRAKASEFLGHWNELLVFLGELSKTQPELKLGVGEN